MLAGRNVALAVSGSIAAVRTVELAHELRRHGATVRAIMSPDAAEIIDPQALEFATEHPVVTSITGAVEHVELCGDDGWADVLLIAPSTANTIGKIASAIDDTPVTTCATTAIGADIPVVLAPAMHAPMADHPGVNAGLDTLQDWGIDVVPPRHEEGKAKIATEDAIVMHVERAIGPSDLAGQRIIVTSGPTSEAVDPVRILTNRSSGRMGRAVARACVRRGATVTVLHGGPDVPIAENVVVETAREMREAALARMDDADVLISAAAIGDFHITTADEKLDSRSPTTIDLEPAPKLLDAVREAAPDSTLVGFKAEHGGREADVIAAARELRARIDAAFVVANDARVMGAEETEALLVDAEDAVTVTGSKDTLAARIADRLAGRPGAK